MDIKELKLSDTVAMMNSDDYRERFRAEYFQLLIRHHKLLDMCQKLDLCKLDFKPTCSSETYSEQLVLMSKLLVLMKKRAQIEGIDIDVSNIELPSELSPSVDSEKLVLAGKSLEFIKAELSHFAEFWCKANAICNNAFIEGLAIYSTERIKAILCQITESEAWQYVYGEPKPVEVEQINE